MSLEFVPNDGWRYFYSDGTAAESDTTIDNALRDTGFYENWTLSDFDEPDVLSLAWQDGSVPIGFGFPPDRFAAGTELATPVDGRNRTVFLRQTFNVPADLDTPMAIDLAARGATIYLDGVEILRENCCISEDFDPVIGRPGFLDKSAHVTTITGLHVIDNLSPGPHTIAASAHPSGASHSEQLFDLRLFSPITEKPWLGSDVDDWLNADNWYFGVPGPDDFAVFRRENRAHAQLDTTVTLSGIQLDTASYTGHTVEGNGEIRIEGKGDDNGGLNATGGHHSLLVDIRMNSDVDAHVQSAIIDIEGEFNLNDRTLTKTGDGALAVMSHNQIGSGTIAVQDGTLSGSGTVAGDVVTSNGLINPGDPSASPRRDGRTLTVRGNVTGRVELDLFSMSRFDILAGADNGMANVEHLKITANRLETQDGATFQLFTDWPELNIGEVELPDIGTAEWDTSQLQDGVLTVSQTNPSPCDFDASGFCTVADLDLLTIDVVEGGNDPRFDMNGDTLVDGQDVDKWLSDAAILNGFGSAYVPGDANLDGSVDASDLMTVGLNWQAFRSGWSNADFTLDGIVDVRDLNELGKNWQNTLVSPPAAVPEPISFLLMFSGVTLMYQCVRRLRGHGVTVHANVTEPGHELE